jgi:hypothetical protein
LEESKSLSSAEENENEANIIKNEESQADHPEVGKVVPEPPVAKPWICPECGKSFG